MIKALGAALVIVGATSLGFAKVLAMRQHISGLAALVTSLELMRGEICVRLTPIPELMYRLALEAPKPARQLFASVGEGLENLGSESFQHIWIKAVESVPDLGLGREEVSALCLLGHSLGRYDAGEQEAALNHCIGRMAGFLEEARERLKSQGRLWTGLGLAGGVMLAVVLL